MTTQRLPNSSDNSVARGALSAEIRRLARIEYNPAYIARRVGTSTHVVRSIVSKARRAQLRPKPIRPDRRRIGMAGKLLTDATLAAIGLEAKRQGLEPEELVAELLTIVAEDGLFSALLDREAEE